MSTDSRISAGVLASRRNGAKSRGPRTAAGKARSARNALKHGMRAAKYLVLPYEDAAEFAALEAALLAELAPVGALQTVLARRVAVAAWRLARADRLEAEVLEFRSSEGANAGIALIRDGNGTRSFETLLRYRAAAMAEFTRALKTLKALQAEQAKPVAHAPGAALALAAPAGRPAARPTLARRARPNEPEPGAARLMEHALPEPPTPGRALHEPAVPWLPNEPEPRGAAAPALARRTNPGPLPCQTIAADGALPTPGCPAAEHARRRAVARGAYAGAQHRTDPTKEPRTTVCPLPMAPTSRHGRASTPFHVRIRVRNLAAHLPNPRTVAASRIG
jgi:hypothetical protein